MSFNQFNSPLIDEAKTSRYKHNFVIETLIFILVYFIGSSFASILPGAYMIWDIFKKNITDPNTILQYATHTPDSLTMISLYCTIFITFTAIFYCTYIEKRSLSSMGIKKDNAVKRYLTGLLIGVGIFSLAVLICCILGSVKIVSFNSNVSFGMVIIFLFGYILQGASEEVLFRGYFMISMTNKSKVLTAIIVNSVVFSLLHGLNPNVTLLAFFNIFLFGVFASLYTLRTNSLIGGCAIHTAWNFVQGNLFGFQVSGLTTNASILTIKTNSSSALLNGGAFGMEGGLAVTIVLLLCIVAIIYYNGSSLKSSNC